MSILGKDLLLSAAILTTSPYENKLQEGQKQKEAREQRRSFSKIRLQNNRQSGSNDAYVSVIFGELEMNRLVSITNLKHNSFILP